MASRTQGIAKRTKNAALATRSQCFRLFVSGADSMLKDPKGGSTSCSKKSGLKRIIASPPPLRGLGSSAKKCSMSFAFDRSAVLVAPEARKSMCTEISSELSSSALRAAWEREGVGAWVRASLHAQHAGADVLTQGF